MRSSPSPSTRSLASSWKAGSPRRACCTPWPSEISSWRSPTAPSSSRTTPTHLGRWPHSGTPAPRLPRPRRAQRPPCPPQLALPLDDRLAARPAWGGRRPERRWEGGARAPGPTRLTQADMGSRRLGHGDSAPRMDQRDTSAGTPVASASYSRVTPATHSSSYGPASFACTPPRTTRPASSPTARSSARQLSSWVSRIHFGPRPRVTSRSWAFSSRS